MYQICISKVALPGIEPGSPAFRAEQRFSKTDLCNLFFPCLFKMPSGDFIVSFQTTKKKDQNKSELYSSLFVTFYPFFKFDKKLENRRPDHQEVEPDEEAQNSSTISNKGLEWESFLLRLNLYFAG